MTSAAQPDDSLAKRNLIVLILAQATLGAQMPLIFTIGGLAGKMLAPNACLATLPITATVVGSMMSANPLSALMSRYGRRAGFIAGTMGGMAGAALCALALSLGSFPLFLLGAFCSGIYQSSQGFFRFAAADTASAAFRPKAISWVTAGGLVAAITGPEIVKLTAESAAVPFLGSYMTVIALNLVFVWLFFLLKIPTPVQHKGAAGGRTRRQLLSDPRIRVAVIVAAVSYALMNLVMTSSPLAVVGCGYQTSDAANVVAAHVLAMFVPSFFTGNLIARFGVEKIMGIGLFILAAAGAVAIAGVELENFFVALILLGIGWNFGFIGATTMLTASHSPEERGKMQGLNDFLVFGGVTIASMSSGGLMNCSGSSVIAGWQAVNLAMLPFLILAGGSLIWLAFRRPE
ncbi:MFS transporter [Stagnihabitans tardus]|uniref:MFS transporter n=1 Tax=Stagnihabitans tardus TaxID=2699202 RepID=A0AAE4YAN6_9RHOB|nr:MFS transporter [Stagnihabitans tardus]NBZ86100.1 MFS transporter [Stagnihabitans tardus]